MLVLDDSYSMISEGGIPNRLNSLKTVLHSLLTNDKYNKTILWNVYTLNGSGAGDNTGADGTSYTPAVGMWGYRSYPMFKNFVDGSTLDGGIQQTGTKQFEYASATPTTVTFVYAANELYRNIKYKCQNNFMILLSDGDTNFDTYVSGGYGYNSYYTTETSIAASKAPAYLQQIYELNSNTDNTRRLPTAYSYALPTYTAAWHALATGCGSSPQQSGPWCGKDKTYHAFSTDANSSCSGLVVGKGTSWKRFDHHCQNSSTWNGVYNGIEYFTDKLYNKDLKPDSEKDVEGNAFTGKQNIQTFTIAYGNDMSAQGEAYAILGARVDDKFKNKNPDKRKVTSKPKKRADDDGYGYYPEAGYYWIDDANKDTQLQEAFTEIFDNVVSTTQTFSEASSNISDADVSEVSNTGSPEVVVGTTTNESSNTSTSENPEKKNSSGVTTGTPTTGGKQGTPTDGTSTTTTTTGAPTENLYTTSVATPVNISSFNLDVSMYPDLTTSEPITGTTDTPELGAYGMEMTLGINTGNWASFFNFHPIFKISVREGVSISSVIDTTKYTCNVSGTSEKAITSYVCSYNNDEYFTPKFLSQRPVLMSLPSDNEKRAFGLTQQGFAEFGLTSTGKANNTTHAIYKNFGFEDEGLKEFDTGFFPWLLRDGTVTDEQIEANVAALNLAERVVAKYRNRLEVKDTPAIEREMGDVIDANPITVPSYVPIADTKEEQKALEASRDRAQYSRFTSK